MKAHVATCDECAWTSAPTTDEHAELLARTHTCGPNNPGREDEPT